MPGVNDPVLGASGLGEQYYFAHSFGVFPLDDSCLIAQLNLNGTSVATVVRVKNAYGLQFHPEKSGSAGLKLLSKFWSFSKCVY